jgi:hypothetical protein
MAEPVIVADRATAEALHPMVGRTYPDIPTALDALVEASGGTPDGVAEILTAAQVTGDCGDANECALVIWLLAVVDGHIPGVLEVQPCDEDSGGEVSWGDDGEWCALPPLLNRFAAAFDGGDYPALMTWHDGDRLIAPGDYRDGDTLYGTVIDNGARVKWDGIGGSDTVGVARSYFGARKVTT